MENTEKENNNETHIHISIRWKNKSQIVNGVTWLESAWNHFAYRGMCVIGLLCVLLFELQFTDNICVKWAIAPHYFASRMNGIARKRQMEKGNGHARGREQQKKNCGNSPHRHIIAYIPYNSLKSIAVGIQWASSLKRNNCKHILNFKLKIANIWWFCVGKRNEKKTQSLRSGQTYLSNWFYWNCNTKSRWERRKPLWRDCKHQVAIEFHLLDKGIFESQLISTLITAPNIPVRRQ